MNEKLTGYRLSPQQRRVWAAERRGDTCYAQTLVWLEGKLDRDRLQKALQKVMHRYEVLRTTFHRSPGRIYPLQVVRERIPAIWNFIDGTDCRSKDQRHLIAELLHEERQPMVWEHGPFMRDVVWM